MSEFSGQCRALVSPRLSGCLAPWTSFRLGILDRLLPRSKPATEICTHCPSPYLPLLFVLGFLCHLAILLEEEQAAWAWASMPISRFLFMWSQLMLQASWICPQHLYSIRSPQLWPFSHSPLPVAKLLTDSFLKKSFIKTIFFFIPSPVPPPSPTPAPPTFSPSTLLREGKAFQWGVTKVCHITLRKDPGPPRYWQTSY